ncbi:MAG TPA: fibronectin type III domain-containing protein [Dongiaceae bacterium]|nr:fibronectin type III domain-containing protein [Dongiaceae bacterium]
MPPAPPVPVAINDLAAQQQGNGVQLSFSLPGRTISGDRLAEPPAAEIFRASGAAGTPENKSFKLVYTIPGALADVYAAQGKIVFLDPISPDELRAHPGALYAYRVRTRASRQKDSADSNTVAVKVFPVAAKIPSLEARVTQSAIELSWPAATSKSLSGETVAGYHVYRGELDPSAPALPNPNDLSQAKWKSPPILLAPAQTNSYRDTLFDFGKTYVYQVRSIVIAEGNPIESDNSAPAIVAPRDIFPPEAPRNVVVAVVPMPDGSTSVELSWSINVEPDLAGYRVYRSETAGQRGAPLQSQLLLSPAYRDLDAHSGHKYWYTITALDRAGNESNPSAPAPADLQR